MSHFKYRFHSVNMDSIYKSFKPFYYLSKLLGVFPMSFQGKAGNGELKTKWHDFVISILSFTFLICLITSQIKFNNFLKSDSSISTKASEISVLIALFFLLISFVFQISKRHQIVNFLKLLNSYDIEVKTMKMKIVFCKTKVFIFLGKVVRMEVRSFQASFENSPRCSPRDYFNDYFDLCFDASCSCLFRIL